MNRDGFFLSKMHATLKEKLAVYTMFVSQMVVPSTNYGLMVKARTSPIDDNFERGTCSCPYSMPTCAI